MSKKEAPPKPKPNEGNTPTYRFTIEGLAKVYWDLVLRRDRK